MGQDFRTVFGDKNGVLKMGSAGAVIGHSEQPVDQVRHHPPDGSVERISPVESDAYFETRPLDSRLSVYASKQSEAIENRDVLEEAFERVRRTYGNGAVPRPEWWGGYRIVPDEFEFWQGRTSRLHDRLRYLKQPDGSWHRERLAP